MGNIVNAHVNHQDYYSPDFELTVNRHVENIIYSLPEPEYRESLEKAGNYNKLKSTLGIFVSGALVNYAIINNLSPVGVNWGFLNINILDAINGLKEGKCIIDTIEDIIDYIETVDSVDEFLAKISGDEDGSVMFDFFGELLDAL